MNSAVVYDLEKIEGSLVMNSEYKKNRMCNGNLNLLESSNSLLAVRLL